MSTTRELLWAFPLLMAQNEDDSLDEEDGEVENPDEEKDWISSEGDEEEEEGGEENEEEEEEEEEEESY